MPYKVIVHPNGLRDRVPDGKLNARDDYETAVKYGGPPVSFPSANHRSAVLHPRKAATKQEQRSQPAEDERQN
jgi:hypothetical protein